MRSQCERLQRMPRKCIGIIIIYISRLALLLSLTKWQVFLGWFIGVGTSSTIWCHSFNVNSSKWQILWQSLVFTAETIEIIRKNIRECHSSESTSLQIKKNGNVIKITQVFPVEQFISMWQLKIEFRINSPIELRNKISIQHNILWYIFIRIQ